MLSHLAHHFPQGACEISKEFQFYKETNIICCSNIFSTPLCSVWMDFNSIPICTSTREGIFLCFNRPAVVLTLYLQNHLQQSLRHLINIYTFPVSNGTIRLITFATKYETGFCKPGIFHIIKIQPAYFQCTNFNKIYSCRN